MPNRLWSKIQETIVIGLLSFAAFFMWNADQTLMVHDFKLNNLEHRVDKLEG